VSSSSKNFATPPQDQSDRLDAAIVEILKAHEKGESVQIESIIERYPDLESEIRDFINNLFQMDRVAAPVRGRKRRAESMPLPADFEKYVLLREIGRGGMGVIYEARSKDLDRRVALKMIRENRFSSADDLARFRNEALAGAGLDHPNIVPIYRVSSEGEHPFFTMKLLDAGSLKDVFGKPHDLPPRSQTPSTTHTSVGFCIAT